MQRPHFRSTPTPTPPFAKDCERKDTAWNVRRAVAWAMLLTMPIPTWPRLTRQCGGTYSTCKVAHGRRHVTVAFDGSPTNCMCALCRRIQGNASCLIGNSVLFTALFSIGVLVGRLISGNARAGCVELECKQHSRMNDIANRSSTHQLRCITILRPTETRAQPNQSSTTSCPSPLPHTTTPTMLFQLPSSSASYRMATVSRVS